MWKNSKGHLDLHETKECPVCLEEKPCFSQPKCNHWLCVDCFRRFYYGEEKEDIPFPYSPDIEQEYDENPDDPKWTQNELIQLWKQQSDLLEDRNMERYEEEEYLRLCPICRQSN